MALTSLTHFWNNKSIKLSDAFVVLIKFKYDDEFEELNTCCGFTIPKIEYEEETMVYGNMEQIFLTPKYDSCKELTLDFYETWEYEKNPNKHSDEDPEFIIKPSYTLERFFQYLNLSINQKYNDDNIKETNYGLYDSDLNEKIIDNITIKILNNKLNKYIYEYVFSNLKLINYSLYTLEYQSDSPCKITLNLAFEGYEKSLIDEEIDWDEEDNNEEETPLNDEENNENYEGNEDNSPNQPIESINPPDASTPPNTDPVDSPKTDDLPPENNPQGETPNNEEPSQPAGDLKPDENPKQPEDNKEEPATETEVNSAPTEQPKNEEPKAETPSANKGTTNQDNGTSNDLGGEQPGADKTQNEEKGIGEKGQDTKPAESETKPAEESKGGEQSQPDPNYHKDELGNEKYESEEGTLYKTEDGKTYYEDKESGKVYDVDNGFVESNAHEGLVSETKNGDTQYYTSVVDNGEEVYRGKNVTTEVNTSEHAKHTQDNAGQSRTPPNIGANESGSQNNTTVSQTSEGGGQSAHDAAEEARKRKEEEMKAAEEAKKSQAAQEQQADRGSQRGQTRGATPPTRGVGGGGSSGPSHAEESEGFYNNGANR
jgi:hypothetical protein